MLTGTDVSQPCQTDLEAVWPLLKGSCQTLGLTYDFFELVQYRGVFQGGKVGGDFLALG